MITQDAYMKYDTTDHYYYLTLTGASEYTGLDILQSLWDESRVKRQGRYLHRAMIKSAYNMKQERYRHRDHIEYRVFLNEQDEREQIKEVLTEFALACYHSDLDLDIMMGEKDFPRAMLDTLVSSGLIFKGEIRGEPIPEDEYRVGY